MLLSFAVESLRGALIALLAFTQWGSNYAEQSLALMRCVGDGSGGVERVKNKVKVPNFELTWTWFCGYGIVICRLPYRTCVICDIAEWVKRILEESSHGSVGLAFAD